MSDIVQQISKPFKMPTGDEVLGYVRKYLEYFACWPDDATLDAVVLWAAHAHAKDENGMLVWQASPRLLFQSAEPGSGKTWAMRLVSRITPAPAVFTEPSEPAVAHAIGKEHATLFLDECDVLFGAGNRKSAIRAVINDGYTPDGSWARVRGGTVEKIPTFSALAMAGLESLETGTGSYMRATLSRCIRVRMKRGPGDYMPPRFDNNARAIAGKITALLTQWVGISLDVLSETVPDMPDSVGNRQRELWEPLISIADLAGGRWPAAGRAACERMTSNGQSPQDLASTANELDGLMSSAWENIADEITGHALPEVEPAPEPAATVALSVPAAILATLSDSEEPLTGPALAETLGADYGTVRTALSRLAASGQVNRTPDGYSSPEQIARLERKLNSFKQQREGD